MAYENLTKRIGIAAAVILTVAVSAYLLLLPREAPVEAYVSGIVVAPDGTPIHDATVYVLHNPYEDPQRVTMPSTVHARSGAGGAFTVGGLQYWDYYLMATHPDHCDSVGVAVRVASPDVRGVHLQLLEGGTIEGSVDPSQGPVAGRHIQLYSRAGSRGWKSALTDKEGRFKIEKVIPEDYTIELRTIDNDNSHIRLPVTVTRGRTTQVILGRN